MRAIFYWLGAAIYARRRLVVALWLGVILLGALGASRLPAALLGGAGSIAGSASDRVEQVLYRDFKTPYGALLLVCIASPQLTVADPAYQALLRDASTRLRAMGEVQRVTGVLDVNDPRLRSADGHRTLLMVGLRAPSVREQELAVPRVRAALAKPREGWLALDPRNELATTGQAALSYDISLYNEHDGQRAELAAVPLTLIILIIAFGSLAAAGLPLALAAASTSVALGLSYLASFAMPLSGLLANIVTMTGLAVGIDYALLVVSRFRVAIAERDVAEALAETVATAGLAVFYSGLTVMVGLAGLWFTPVMETRSIGVGGALVVAVSVLAALTLLPALLGFLGPRVDWPAAMARPLRYARGEQAWVRLARFVMAHRFLVLLAAGLLAGLVASPAFRLHSGFIAGYSWLPAAMEARQGNDILQQMGRANAGMPINVVVRTTDGSGILGAAHLRELLKLSRDLAADRRVGEVLSPVDLDAKLKPVHYAILYAHLDQALARYPQIEELVLSRDHSAALFQLVPAPGVTVDGAQALARDLTARPQPPALTLDVGGLPSFYNDFQDRLEASIPRVVGLVVGVTLGVLFLAFRSWLLPLKAVALNLLAVGAGYGALVLVFQEGYGASWIGLSAPLGAIPLAIPVIIFCITFGLSMDYEIFLLSSIKEAYDETHDNEAAIARGLASTGGIITSAASIMAVVFGAFVGADIALIKMIGLGLAVAVVIDATLIRVLMAPALMALGGRYNWLPGDRHPR